MRAVLTLMIYGLAILVPNIYSFIGFLGNIGYSLFSFFYPTVFHYLHFKRRNRTLPYCEYVLLIVFVVFSITFGTYEFAK